jgi:phosphatidylglycerophosphatase A
MNRPLSPAATNLVTTFGLGFRRPAAGTWGSLPPVVVAAVLLGLGFDGQGAVFSLCMAILTGLFAGVCVRFGDRAASAFGRSDPSQVVADETAGMALVLAFLPAGSTDTALLAALTLALAFVAFRVFDIFKPWPAYALERAPGGWGILLDDLMAGVYAIVSLHLAALVL